jgi:hypothetical protein
MMDPTQDAGVSKVIKPPATTYRKLRVVLDCILILLVILVASGNRLAARAELDRQNPSLSRVGVVDQAEEMSSPTGEQPAPALIDNNTLAAIIAAENAALTPPLYFSTLPLIAH